MTGGAETMTDKQRLKRAARRLTRSYETAEKQRVQNASRQAEMIRLCGTLSAVRQLLIKLEWSGLIEDGEDGYVGCCPSCEGRSQWVGGNTITGTHGPDCALAAAILSLNNNPQE